MEQENTRTLFRKYALPQMWGLLFNSIYLIVDGIFIGNRLGRQSMAAAAAAVPLIELMIAVALAVSAGAGALISRSLAQKNKEEANAASNTAILFLGIVGVLISIFGNLLINPLADLLGVPQSLHHEAINYLRYIVSFAPFLLYSFLFGGLARNDGCPKLAMFALTFGSLSNILLDYVFMYPLIMGIGGAALATALGPIFSVLILLPHFIAGKGQLRPGWNRMDFQLVKRILVLGLPSFVMEFSIGIITFVYNMAITRQSDAELGLAAYLLIGYMMLIVLTLFLGMAEGLQPVFSYFSGKQDTARIHELKRYSTRVFILMGIAAYILILFFGQDFYFIFSPEDPALVEYAARISRIYFCGFFLAGFNILMISIWQATAQTGKALLTALLRSAIFPPLLVGAAVWIANSQALWLSHSLAELLTAAVALFLSSGQSRREKHRIEGTDSDQASRSREFQLS